MPRSEIIRSYEKYRFNYLEEIGKQLSKMDEFFGTSLISSEMYEISSCSTSSLLLGCQDIIFLFYLIWLVFGILLGI